jgi:hypothetical protein
VIWLRATMCDVGLKCIIILIHCFAKTRKERGKGKAEAAAPDGSSMQALLARS